MDTVMINQLHDVISINEISETSASVKIYAPVSTHCSIMKNEIVYEIQDNEVTVSNEECENALSCLSEFGQKYDIEQKICTVDKSNKLGKHGEMSKMHHGNTTDMRYILDTEQTVMTSFETTDDESMAVEALRQLGTLYTSVIPPEQNSDLNCTNCDIKYLDLNAAYKQQEFICSLCHDAFAKESDFNIHVCHKFPCKFCTKFFSALTDLRQHVSLNHPGDRPYKCHVCDQNFPRPSSLTNHLKIHNYQPGRALLSKSAGSNAVNEASHELNSTPKLENVTVESQHPWPVEKVYLPDSLVNNSAADPLASWQFSYDSSNSVSSLSKILVGNDCSRMQDGRSGIFNDHSGSVKVELVLPFVSGMDKDGEEPHSISSMPQMEVTIASGDTKPYLCAQCGATFAREKSLNSHLRGHSVVLYDCDLCGDSFQSDGLRSQHRQHCTVDDPLFVTQHSSAGEQGLVKNQEASVDNNESVCKPQLKVAKHACPGCDKRFATKQKMFRHMWIHRKKSFSCEHCPMTFEMQIELDKHRLSIHPADSPYVCQECGKSFASRQGLWEHGRLHGGGAAGMFSCAKCNKSFASRQGYLIHNRIHTGERPYGCRYCLKAFRDGGTLRKHERIHTGERPHVCPICKHDFNQKVVLREHVRWVHAAVKVHDINGQFVCQLCDATVSDREELCAHIVRHSDQSKHKTVVNGTSRIVNGMETPAIVAAGAKVKQKQAEFFEIDKSALAELNFSSEDRNVACDLCGNKFASQKDLMTHIHIHI